MSTADALLRVLESQEVPDAACNPANVVDVLHDLAGAARKIGNAITPTVAGGNDATGGHVESLTEAVMGITSGLVRVAESISDLADAVRSRGE